MNDLTFEILQKIRSHLWETEYAMSIHRDDLQFLDSEDRLNLMRMLGKAASQITDHIHAENGWNES